MVWLPVRSVQPRRLRVRKHTEAPGDEPAQLFGGVPVAESKTEDTTFGADCQYRSWSGLPELAVKDSCEPASSDLLDIGGPRR
jgi:hypothetical protein